MKREVFHYNLSEIAPFIDWSYFFHAWGVSGNKVTKATIDEMMHDAKSMLENLDGIYKTHAIFTLCEAKGNGDDIIIEGKTIPFLRQQHTETEKHNLCLSDFVSPHGDYIGFFATTIDKDFGAEYKDDPYLYLLAQTLADRLTEATAARLHQQVRTDNTLWGYYPDEKLSISDLLAEKNQGIRPAVGYPSLPDQSIIFEFDKFLHLDNIGITLTPNGAMTPHASVCGMILAHPKAHYFAVGKISEEQFADYARRRRIDTTELRKFLSKNIEQIV